MELLIVLIAGVFLAKLGNHQNPRNYSLLILSIFGICYFFAWKYLNFYRLIFEPTNDFLYLENVSLIGITIGFVLLAQKLQKYDVFVGLMVTIFCVCAVASFSLDRQIKHKVSDLGGYFDKNVSGFYRSNAKLENVEVFDHEAGGFRMKVPGTWDKLKHSSGQWYFKNNIDGLNSVELRPRCFHESDLSLAEIVNNNILTSLAQNISIEKICGSDDQVFECLTLSTGNIGTQYSEFWRWYLVNEKNRQSIEVDLIFDGDSPIPRTEAKAILNSLKLYELPHPLPYCINSVDWF